MDKWRGTKGKWHFVDYAGTYIIQDGDKYEDSNILDCDVVAKEEAKANAQLIATAPELLEDLQEAVDLFESAYKCMASGDNEGLYNALANATSRTRFKETINKALGKEEGDE